jgi:hypothetical protein
MIDITVVSFFSGMISNGSVARVFLEDGFDTLRFDFQPGYRNSGNYRPNLKLSVPWSI